MALEWPNWIKPVTSKSYGYSFSGDNMSYTQVSGGLSRANLKYIQNKEQYGCVFVINNGEDMQGLNDWYFEVSNQGTSTFTMDLDCGDGLLSHNCIIVPGSYSVTGDHPWVVTATIEAEKVVTAEFSGGLYELLQAGYTDIQTLFDRLAISANDDISVIGNE